MSYAQMCAFFSATGILFMSWVGVLLVTQPFFVGGIKDVEASKVSAFGAAATFLLCFVISALSMIRDAQRQVRGGGGAGGSSSVGSSSHHSGASLTELFSRTPIPLAAGGSLFHDYDPVDTDEIDRGVMA